jgi:type IV secretory pathway VirB2 component (pilin)
MLRYIFGLVVVVLIAMSSYTQAQVAPSFDRNFGRYLTSDTPDEFGRVENVFNLCIRRDISLRENIIRLFYPSRLPPAFDIDEWCASARGWLFRDIFRRLWVALLFIFFIFAGIQLVIRANDDEARKKSLMSMLYILYGWFLFLWSTWILWDVLNIANLQGSEQLADNLENNLFLQILTLLKGLAFFVAIVFLVIYGYRIMAATDQEEKLKTAKTGILNIIISLVAIKVIDYLYYIASVPTFGSDAANLILQIATVLGYIIGAMFMLSIFYLGFLLLTGRWEEETVTKAKNIVVTILLSALVIFLFLLIIYQVMKEIG